MDFVRPAFFAIALFAGITLAAPLKAQATATLKVTARVVNECTIYSKRELVKRARALNDPSLIRRCSKGVVSRVDQRRVKISQLRPRTPMPGGRSKKRISRRTAPGSADVVLFTVTY